MLYFKEPKVLQLVSLSYQKEFYGEHPLEMLYFKEPKVLPLVSLFYQKEFLGEHPLEMRYFKEPIFLHHFRTCFPTAPAIRQPAKGLRIIPGGHG